MYMLNTSANNASKSRQNGKLTTCKDVSRLKTRRAHCATHRTGVRLYREPHTHRSSMRASTTSGMNHCRIVPECLRGNAIRSQVAECPNFSQLWAYFACNSVFSFAHSADIDLRFDGLVPSKTEVSLGKYALNQRTRGCRAIDGANPGAKLP
jgi:hypothetical protein